MQSKPIGFNTIVSFVGGKTGDAWLHTSFPFIQPHSKCSAPSTRLHFTIKCDVPKLKRSVVELALQFNPLSFALITFAFALNVHEPL